MADGATIWSCQDRWAMGCTVGTVAWMSMSSVDLHPGRGSGSSGRSV